MGMAKLSFSIKSNTVRRSSGRYLAELTATERLPLDRLLTLQAERAAGIATFAGQNTVYYARRFAEATVDVARLHERDEWRRIPISTRTDFKANEFDILSTEANKRTARIGKTGGSTGEPLRTRHDNRVPNLALAWRMYRWWGVEPWDNIARVGRWGFGWKDTVKNILTWWPSRQVYLDATLFDAQSMREFHARLVRTRPALIEGYVGAMLELADFLEAENLQIRPPRALATTASVLTESSRRRLESVFGTQIFDEYRGAEVAWMAGECRAHAGLHINADARLIEIVDEYDRPVTTGDSGDIVVTDLTNRVFPIIRYRLGDRARLLPEPCPCGLSLPLMSYPEGRVTDVLRLPSGEALNHGLLGMFADHPESVRLFQIHQKIDHSIDVNVVLGPAENGAVHVEDAVQKLRRRIDHKVPVRINFVEAMPYTGGKVKYVISDVPAPGESAEGLSKPDARD